jgi:hypothetical protein
MSPAKTRLLFTGSFDADYHARALDALCARADAGARDILYIVASSAARRRAVADLLARRSAVFGLQVVTLRSLPDELLRRAHAPKLEPIDPVVADVLTERALRVATAGRFSATTPLRGLASKAASTIDLLERHGATAERLASVVADGAYGDGARVLANAWALLSRRRWRYGTTDATRLLAAARLLRREPSVLDGTDVVVLEDVPLLTRVERFIIRSIVAAARGDVIASYGNVRHLPQAPSSRSLAALRRLARWDETVIPRLTARSDNTRPAATVRLLESAGDVGEVRLAARVVRRHLDAGVAPEEIALIVHANAARYRELVREIFTPLGIPVAAHTPRAVSDTGLGSVLLRVLELAIIPDRTTRESSLAVARAPHLDLDADEGDRLHRQVVTAGFMGLDGWTDLAVKTLGAAATSRVNQLKRAVESARGEFTSVRSAAHAARVARRLARDLKLLSMAYIARQRTMRRVARTTDPLSMSSAAAVREDNLAWEAIDVALDRTVPQMLEIDRGASGKHGLDYAAAWLVMLERALRETTVAPAHAPAHAVQLRGTGPGCEAPERITIVLGLLEKRFPRQPRQDPFLGDDLRVTLRERFGWDLTTSADAMDRERECFARAVSSATETLYLSYSSIDADGRPAVRSFFIDDLQATLGAEIPVERLGGATAIVPVNDAATTTDLVASVAHDIWQYLPRTANAEARRAMAFRALESLARRDGNVSVVRHGRRVSQRPALDRVVMPEHAPHLTLTLSASQLKSISHCTYKHFVEKVLDPKELVPPEYNALSKGSLIHDAIMQWATGLHGWTRGEDALPELHDWIRKQIAEWPPSKHGKDRAARAMDADIERLDELLRNELALLRTGGVAQPMYAELAFGEEMEERGPRDPASRLEAFELVVKTSRGDTPVKFRGSMDRVDVVTVDGKRYGVIIDYKTGRTSKRYADAMQDGTDLQLRLYLLVLEQFWGITPIGALYLGFGDGVRRGIVRAELAGRIAGLEDKAVELLGADAWSEMLVDTTRRIGELADRLVRLDVTVAPRDNDCGFCELATICRFDRWETEVVRG